MIGLGDEEPIPSESLHDYYSEDSWQELRDVAVPAVNRTGHWEGRSRLRNMQDRRVAGRADDHVSREAAAERPAQLPGHRASRRRPSDRLREALEDPGPQTRHPRIVAGPDHHDQPRGGDHRVQSGRGAGLRPLRATRCWARGLPTCSSRPRSAPEHRNRIERYLEAGEGSMLGKRVEVTASRANGEMFPAEMAMTIGQIKARPVLTFFVRDISLRKKAEEEQARYAAELERSNRDLEQFAYVASHDLQEPLRKIRAFGDRLEVKCQEPLDETGRECVSRMQNAAARMQELIEGLLTLSRVTTRRDDFVPVDLARSRARWSATWRRRSSRPRAGGGGQAADDPGRTAADPAVAAEPDRQRPEIPPPRRAAGGEDRGPLRGGANRRERERSLAEEKCRITVEDNGIGFDHGTRSGSSAFSSGCTPATFTRERASAWPSAGGSSSITAARSRAQRHARQGLDLRGAAAGGPAREDGVSDAKSRAYDSHGRRRCGRLPVGPRGPGRERPRRTTCASSATARSCWTTCTAAARMPTPAAAPGPT